MPTFQKVATVLLLCTPSNLNKAWVADDIDQANALLDSLGYSPEGLIEAKSLLAKLKGEANTFSTVAEGLKLIAWDGEEPHPPDVAAQSIVAEMRALDNQ